MISPPTSHPFERQARYLVQGELGSGGSASVYAAFDRLSGRRVALKVFYPPAAGATPAAGPVSSSSPPRAGEPAPPVSRLEVRPRELARGELRALSSLTHPGIVRVFDHGFTPDGLPYLSMELIEGPDLATFARALPEGEDRNQQLVGIAGQLLSALCHVHDRGILHLDLKPANILVPAGPDRKPSPRLIDFALASAFPLAAGGTLDFTAPEVLRGAAPGPRSDLYSLGVTLHEALTGTRLHDGGTPEALIKQVLEGPPLDASRLPAPWRELLPRLLERDPELRIPSARAALEALLGPRALPPRFPDFEAVFVAREDALRDLDDAGRAARSGRPRGILLRGPQGCGKSRLLGELHLALELEGMLSGIDTATPGAPRPGALLTRIVERVTLELASTPGEAAGAALRTGQGAAADLEAERDRFFHAASRALLEAAARRPLAILVDGLERIDSLSRDGLLHLLRAARAAESCSLMVVATLDEDELEPGGDLERQLAEDASLRSTRLENLDRRQAGFYLERLLGPGVLTDEECGALVEETGGNFGFLTERIKLLLAAGHLRDTGRGWQLVRGVDWSTPSSRGDALSRRLDRLAGPVQRTIEWMSVVERPVSVGELVALEGQGSAEELELRIADLCAQGFVLRRGDEISLSSTALRRTAYGRLEEGDRQARHGALAARLLPSGEERPEELAQHLYLSGDTRRARLYFKAAGDRARQAGALREAFLSYSRALEAEDDPRERFALLLCRQEIAGFLGRKDAQREDLAALQATARALGDSALEREALLREALHLDASGRKREALERLQSASERCGGDRRAEGRILTRRAMVLTYLSDSARAFEDLERALEIARSSRDIDLEGECLQIRGLTRYLAGDLDRAAEDMGAALALRAARGEEHRVASIESNLGLIQLDRGNLEAAEERFQSALKLFRRVAHRRGEAVNLLNLGLVSLELGRSESALDAFTAALRIRRELGDRRGEGADLGNLGAAWLQVGRPERAVPLIEQAIGIARECENRQSESANEGRLGQVALEQGDGELARRRFERALELAVAARVPVQQAAAHLGLSRAFLSLGKSREAEAAARDGLKLTESSRLLARRPGLLAQLAAALRVVGNLAEAESCVSQAVDLLEKRGGGNAEAVLVRLEQHLTLEAAHGPGAGEAALERAYTLLRERSDAFHDEELRQSFLANVPTCREVRRLHAELQARNRREATRRERSFHEIARSLHSILELDPLLDRLLELAIDTTHAEKGLITLKDERGDFILRAARGMARESIDDAAAISKSVIADVARGGEPILAVDAGADERFRERRSIVSYGIRTLLCVPLKARDEVLGAVYVDGRGASSFDQADLEYLVSFAQLAVIAIENVRLFDRLRAENLVLRREVETRYKFENLIGTSPALEKVLRVMEKVADTPASILVTGETGTGKEVIARSIHYSSRRRGRPFVAVDCGALPANLLESELFGHRRGSFSGAVHDRVGLFEEADGGTIFLDEITNTSLDLQAKLLRVLQEGEVRRVGENQPRKVDVRVIAASNVDPRAAVAKGSFREDLYYRLNVVSLEVPPLRERREDIPVLVNHFLKRACARHGKPTPGMTEGALDLLVRASWKGNVRELENLVEKLVILADTDRLDARFVGSFLPAAPPAPEGGGAPVLAGSAIAQAPAAPGLGGEFAGLTLEDLDRRLLQAERAYLERLVRDSDGNLAEAARRAKVRNRNTLISRLKRHGIRGKKSSEPE